MNFFEDWARAHLQISGSDLDDWQDNNNDHQDDVIYSRNHDSLTTIQVFQWEDENSGITYKNLFP